MKVIFIVDLEKDKVFIIFIMDQYMKVKIILKINFLFFLILGAWEKNKFHGKGVLK